ncbi:MAG: RelA/SpoT family protein [Candidatus Paceibacterota bacterium]|jgi:GTP pyrophosphokinase
MKDIKEIISLMQNPTEADIGLIQKAYSFAENAHRGQKRNSGDEYITHLFATAKNIAELGMTATTISVGFLHDLLEDTKTQPEEIKKEFGEEILFLVDGVTKLGEIKYRGTQRYNESLRKLFIAMSQDIRVLIVKLCDRLHNMQTLEYVSQEKQLRIAIETLEIYASIASRLGIKKLQRELEDLAFAYVYKEDHKKTKELLNAKREEQERYLEKFEKLVKKELAKNNITSFKIDHRVKGLYSLYKKLQKYKGNVETIYDISAMRITVPEVSDCYRVLGIIHGAWRPLPERIKDYIASPKINGYRSLHTTIFSGDGGIIEVQIRTEEMHKEAEYGIASHLSYKESVKKVTNPNLLWVTKILPQKSNSKNPNNHNISDDVPNWVKELVEYQKEAGERFIEEVKSDFFEERIFVFTPIGDVIDLPKNSSVIDFAYAIHTDVGDHMSGAKVNGKFVSIETILQNGDRVEIETKKNSKPSIKWLEDCKTTIARRRINNFLERNKK